MKLNKLILFYIFGLLIGGQEKIYASAVDIEEHFLRFIHHSSCSSKDTFHQIQNQDFEEGSYTFHYTYQDSYHLSILSPEYPRYEPIGEMKVLSIIPHNDKHVLIAQWPLKDNPTPGYNTPFEMNFVVSSEAVVSQPAPIMLSLASTSAPNPSSIIPEVERIEEDKFSEIPYSPARALKFVNAMGYDGHTLRMESFASWFCDQYLGFNKEEVGFEQVTGKPVAYNIEVFHLVSYLELIKDHFVSLNPLKFSPTTYEPEGWLNTMMESIYYSLQREEAFLQIRHDQSVRQMLTITTEGIQLGMQKADNISKKIYAISPQGHFYTEGKDCGHHPDLLKGGYAWCAGHISLTNGKITFLSNNSGHYQPHAYHLYTFAEELYKQGLFGEQAEVEILRRINDTSKAETLPLTLFLTTYDKQTLRKNWEIEIVQRIENLPFIKAVLTMS
jgi:hypothetical protein